MSTVRASGRYQKSNIRTQVEMAKLLRSSCRICQFVICLTYVQKKMLYSGNVKLIYLELLQETLSA
jgi:hypothetical protein